MRRTNPKCERGPLKRIEFADSFTTLRETAHEIV
jgi:hypothetical protein